MQKIASFCVDHTKLMPGIYLSRRDGNIDTWDLRLERPNAGVYVDPAAAHTIEHLFATYARNSAYKDHVVYVGPMGCRTGFYLLTRKLAKADVIRLVQDSFAFIAAFEGEIPGAKEAECGNYKEQDLPGAKAVATLYNVVITGWTPEQMDYEA